MEAKRLGSNCGTRMFSMSIVLIGLVSAAGCSTKITVRTSPAMLEQNTMQQIAIIGAGRVEWPRTGEKKDPYVGLQESKLALSLLLRQADEELSAKGYEIVFCEPVGIAYHLPLYREQWVWDTGRPTVDPEPSDQDEEEVREDDSRSQETRWAIVDREPAFLYPIAHDNPEYEKAVREVFEAWNSSIALKEPFTPDMSDEGLDIIRETVGGDTICFNRVYGLKYTKARKAGAIAANLVMGVFSGLLGFYGALPVPNDTVESYFTCVDARTGEVLWQHGIHRAGNPVKPEDEFLTDVLKPFPNANLPVDPQYVKKE